MAFAAVVLARSEILIATLMFHSAARPFASIIDVHSIRRDFKGFSCLHREKGDWRGEGARLVLLYKTRRYGWLHLYGGDGEISTSRRTCLHLMAVKIDSFIGELYRNIFSVYTKVFNFCPKCDEIKYR